MKAKTYAIAGASGAVGEGIVATLLNRGHRVVAIARSNSKLEALREYLENAGVNSEGLVALQHYFSDEQGIEQLSQALQEQQIDAAIASLGGWYHGDPLHKMSLEAMQQTVQGGLMAHLYFAKAAIPALSQKDWGHYVMINGGASEYVVPHSGIISVVAAAQKMMAQVLHEELAKTNVQVDAVAAFDLVKTRQRADDDSLWLSPREIALYVEGLGESRQHAHFWHRLQKPEDLKH